MPTRQFGSSVTVVLPGVSAEGEATLVLVYRLLKSGRLEVDKEVMVGGLENLKVQGEARIVSGLARISCPDWDYEADRVPVEVIIRGDGSGSGSFRPPKAPAKLMQLLEGAFIEPSAGDESAVPSSGIATVISPVTANLQLTGHAPAVTRTVRVPIVGTMAWKKPNLKHACKRQAASRPQEALRL